jgi:CheY-like chemotaxis protein
MRFVDADFSGLDGGLVLVVEDSDDRREARRRILERCGALVATAGTADEAHRLLALLQAQGGR